MWYVCWVCVFVCDILLVFVCVYVMCFLVFRVYVWYVCWFVVCGCDIFVGFPCVCDILLVFRVCMWYFVGFSCLYVIFCWVFHIWVCVTRIFMHLCTRISHMRICVCVRKYMHNAYIAKGSTTQLCWCRDVLACRYHPCWFFVSSLSFSLCFSLCLCMALYVLMLTSCLSISLCLSLCVYAWPCICLCSRFVFLFLFMFVFVFVHGLVCAYAHS